MALSGLSPWLRLEGQAQRPLLQKAWTHRHLPAVCPGHKVPCLQYRVLGGGETRGPPTVVGSLCPSPPCRRQTSPRSGAGHKKQSQAKGGCGPDQYTPAEPDREQACRPPSGEAFWQDLARKAITSYATKLALELDEILKVVDEVFNQYPLYQQEEQDILPRIQNEIKLLQRGRRDGDLDPGPSDDPRGSP